MTILDTIAEATKCRVDNDRRNLPKAVVRAAAENLPGRDRAFEKALRKKGLSFICEVKKASPSKGVIDPAFDHLETAREYAKAGADCISCLTEPEWFLGSDEIFTDIRSAVATPMLRKDFTVDSYQIYQAKCLGADAILLICSLLDPPELAYYLELCKELGLDALVEARDEKQVEMAADAGASIIGVNNRNLKDFSVDLTTTERLRRFAPEDALFVAESGILTADDITALGKSRPDAVLIGEAFTRAADKAKLLKEFREAAL